MASSDSSRTRKSIPLYVVDAFTSKSFGGNPAAICLVTSDDLTDEEMQAIGAEMNLSETAFVVRDSKKDFADGDSFKLRWFTPTVEVALCGHATLAAAAVLFECAENRHDTLDFHTKSGRLSVSRIDNLLSLDFPLHKASPKDPAEFKKLLEVCLEDTDVVQEVQFSESTKKLIVRLKDDVKKEFVEQLKPQIAAMVESEPSGTVKGVGITLKGSKENGCVDSEGQVYDFVSRYFAPWVGIPEDPVCGSLHTVLAHYWSNQLRKASFYARQCSPRGGDIWVKVKGERVGLYGQAVINVKGTFML